MSPRFLTRSPLLRAPAGRRLLAAQAVDVVSMGVATVAIPWLILDGGGSTAAAGLAFATGTLPYVVFGLPAGLLGDRVAPARVFAIGHGLQALFAVGIPFWAIAAGHAPLGVVLVTALALGSVRAFTDAAAFSSIAGIAGREHFTKAQATLTAAWSAGLLVGPAIGGLVIHWLGATDALYVMAGAFALAGLLGSRLPRPPTHDAAARSPGDALRAGLRVIFRDPAIRVLTLVMMAWNVAATGVYALAVPLLRDGLALSAREVGIVFGVGAAMGLVSAPLVGAIDRRVEVPRVLLALIAIHGAAAVGFALSGGLVSAALAYAVLELAGWTTVSVFIGARQQRAPADLQALVGMSGRVLGQATMTLGALLASGATQVVSVRDVYLLMAGATLVVVAVSARPLLRSARAVSSAS